VKINTAQTQTQTQTHTHTHANLRHVVEIVDMFNVVPEKILPHHMGNEDD
jgi:predicted metal-dependent phosphotriesterase family hydrolase